MLILSKRAKTEEGHDAANICSQVELVTQTIQMNLTAKQVYEIIRKGERAFTNLDQESQPLPRSAMQIARFALKPNEQVNASTLAQAVIGIERDKHVAKARLRALREMLEEAELHLEEL